MPSRTPRPLELLDFRRFSLDAHALWHASTAPLGHLLWVYFVESMACRQMTRRPR